MGKIVGKTRLFVSGIVVGSCGLMAASGNLFAANGGSIAFVTSKPKVELNAPKKRVLAPVKTYLTQANKNSQAKNQTGAAGQLRFVTPASDSKNNSKESSSKNRESLSENVTQGKASLAFGNTLRGPVKQTAYRGGRASGIQMRSTSKRASLFGGSTNNSSVRNTASRANRNVARPMPSVPRAEQMPTRSQLPKRFVPAAQNVAQNMPLSTIQNRTHGTTQNMTHGITRDLEAWAVEVASLVQYADTAEEYRQVILACEEVLRASSTGEIGSYAKSTSAWALNRCGQISADAGLDQEALIDFKAAVQMDSECWRAVHNLGVMRAMSGQFAEAFDDFNRTIELNSNFAKAFANRGSLYIQAKDLNSAKEDFARALKIEPKLVVALTGMATVCEKQSDAESAIWYYRQALKQSPNNVSCLIGLGSAWSDLGIDAKALRSFEQAWAANPAATAAYRQAAWIWATCAERNIRNTKKALWAAKRAVQYGGGENFKDLDVLAAAFANAGDFNSAVATQQRALQISNKTNRTELAGRLKMYQQQVPYRTEPKQEVQQASFLK